LVLLVAGFVARRAGVLSYLTHRPPPTPSSAAINSHEPAPEPRSQTVEGGPPSGAPQPSPETVSDAHSSSAQAARPAGVRENLSEADRRELDQILRRKLKQK
jgi:hypothetical protein